jgi:exonuclease III
MTPAGWLAVFITILPYLYLGLFIQCVLSYLIFRKKKWLGLLSLVIISALVIWGSVMIPKSGKPDKNLKSLKVMTWNIERMGEYSDSGNSVNENSYQIGRLIRNHNPDIVSILEITQVQMVSLMEKLDVPDENYMWSDYYGTGNKNYAGLGICLIKSDNGFKIKNKLNLELPPNWKYVYSEICNDDESCLNFIAIHVVPPKIKRYDVRNIVKNMFKFEKDSFKSLIEILNDYEKQISLQGGQTTMVLELLNDLNDPTIIAGDFNSTRDTALHSTMRKSLVDTWSLAGIGMGPTRYWSDFLPLRIDYIYVTHDFNVIKSEVIQSDCSDHLPVISTIQR